MKKLLTILLLFLSTGFGAPVTAQHEGHAANGGQAKTAAQGKKGMSHDHMAMNMANEPHHVLAMAYCQNLTVFAKALRDQTARSSSVNTEFARAAVVEMRRSFDEMKKHHQEHTEAMSSEMQTMMKSTMQQMGTHQTQLNDQLTALEREVQSPTPDAKKVSALAASVLTHVNAMSKMMQGGKGSGMKM